MKNKIAFLLLCAVASTIWAQGIRDDTAQRVDNPLPLRRVAILTSGLTFFEHSGSVSGPVSFELPFRLDAMNDVLKTLVLNDPASANPSITYQSEQTLFQTLRSLNIDLSDEPSLALILSRLRGTEAEVISGTSTYTGRITGIEHRVVSGPQFMHSVDPWLMLHTQRGMRLFNLNEVSSVRFLDAEIERDLNRALDLIAASRNVFVRQLLVNLPGSGRRDVSISYVIPSPVWKVSYRLDLGADSPLFQGWAIVDNDSDTDWENVELSLVAGRPASFIQNLFPPHYVWRPVLPLAIAGAADAVVHDRAAPVPVAAPMTRMRANADMLFGEMAVAEEAWAVAPQAAPQREALVGGVIETAAGAEAGGQFEFTIRTPVTLNRRMSAMLPLVEAPIQAQRLLIFSGSGRHPRLGAEITNTTGMRLPAGPITVFDGGIYAGSALIEFWNEDERRLISFGEDLSVTASSSDAGERVVSSVNVSGGVMTINRRMLFTRTYTFINSDAVAKELVVEHNRTHNTELVSPEAAEQTPTLYRFNITLPANRETTLEVVEQRPMFERIALLPLRPEAFLSHATNHEIPANVRAALQRAAELRRAVDAAAQVVTNLEAQRNRLIADQGRVRSNLEAVGSQTPEGQEFLRRLMALDREIDTLATSLERARNDARAAQTAFENYLTTLEL